MSSWTDKRPMSPHVSIWKWHVTMAASILNRAAGCANYLGAILVVSWLFATAAGPDYYETLAAVVGSIWGQLVLFGFTISVLFHLVNGVRHLFWDAGNGFNPKFASLTGALAFLIAIGGAVAIWFLAGLVPGIDPLNMTGAA